MMPTDSFATLCATVARLRAPGGCPWDREQTNATLAPKLVEEVYEVLAAIAAGDDENLREELGDVLLLVVMHAEIAREEKRFDIEQIAAQVNEKLIRRHPHVFAKSEVRDAAGVVKQWDEIKRTEKKKSETYLGTVGAALPALMRAQKTQSKAARVNFDWKDASDVVAKIEEELAETKTALAAGDAAGIAEEIGDLLFAATNLARKCGLEAESILQNATDKFVRRFNQLEARVQASGRSLGALDLAQLDEIWNAIKSER